MKFRDIRLWLFIFGFIFLIGAYLYQHSRTNQRQLESQAIKAISLAKGSFVESFYSYHDQLEGYLKRNFHKWNNPGVITPASRLVDMFDREGKFEIVKIRLASDAPSKVVPLEKTEIQLVRRDSAYFLHVNGFVFTFEEKDDDGNYPTSDLSDLFRNIPEKMQVDLERDHVDSRVFEISHFVSLFALMHNNLQSLFFDEIYLLDENGTVLYPSRPSGQRLVEGEKLNLAHQMEDRVIFGEYQIQLNISGEKYEGFVSPFLLGNTPLYLLGVKESEQFQKVAYRINFNLLSMFLTGLILVFVSIPVISLFNLSEGDVLTKRRVFGLAFSLIVIMLVLGFSSFSLVQNSRSMASFSEQIDGLIDGLMQSFTEKTEVLLSVMRAYDATKAHGNFPADISRSGINEILEFDNGGMIRNIFIPESEKDPEPIVFDNDPFISIAHRDYVRRLPQDSSRFFISSNFSKATGGFEAVISGRFGNFGRAITFKLNEISPELSNQHRYFIFRPDGKVLLKSNRVNIPFNHMEEGIGEIKWKEILTLIHNNPDADSNVKWEVPVYVNGYEYEGKLKRLPSDHFLTDNWILFLEDKNLQHTLHSLASIEAMVVFFPYLMILVLLAFLTGMAKRRAIYLAFEEFFFGWYSPSPRKRGRFLWLNWLLFVDIILYLLVYFCIPIDIFKMLLWAALFTIQAGTCNFILLYSPKTLPLKGNDILFLISAFLFWSCFAVGLLYLSHQSVDPKYFWATVLIVGFLAGIKVLCLYLSRMERLPSLLPTEEERPAAIKRFYVRIAAFWNRITPVMVDKRIYALNFLLWLMIIGFLPGYFIHRQVFVQEKYIWDRVMGNIANTPAAMDLTCSYSDLIKTYEKTRRVNFAKISTQEDSHIKRFISPNDSTLAASFFLPANISRHRLNGNGNAYWEKVKLNTPVLVLLGFLLFLFFNMIMLLSNKIYLIDYLFTSTKPKLPGSGNKLAFNFIIGMDSRKSRKWILDQFGILKEELLVLDATEKTTAMPAANNSLYKAILAENIHCLKDASAIYSMVVDLKKQYFGQGLMIMVSSARPFQELLALNGSDHEKNVLSEIFSNFLFHFVPLQYDSPVISLPYSQLGTEHMDEGQRREHEALKKSRLFNDKGVEVLASEISVGSNAYFLASLITGELTHDALDQPLTQDRFEKCILSIQRYNKAYYINIWSSLNMREKKMVYNYAMEGFINFSNKEIMTALIQKGIMVLNKEKDALVLFSDSFRNFVCLYTGPEDLVKFKQDERRAGNARMIQAAAFSFVFISIALISYYDPNILNQTSAYVSAVIGLAGTVYSFFVKGFGKKVDLNDK